jgi:8-oxo-dGTP diphosphatase
MQSAALAIVIQGVKTSAPSILLVRRKDVPVWVLPGGGIDPLETPEQAALRETLEETGLTIESAHRVATYYPINALAATTYVVECRQSNESQPVSIEGNAEVSAAAFFKIDALPPTLFPIHKGFIKEWLHAKELPITRLLTEVTYTSILKLFFTNPILTTSYFASCLKRKLFG